jgi:hypothetical protein
MTTERLDGDDGLARLLGAALDTDDPTPDSVREAARAAYTWRTIDAELAELADPVGAGPAFREEEADLQTLSFHAPGLTIELGLSGTALLGQLVPPAPGTVTLRRSDGRTTDVPVDADGCFRIAPPPTGPATLSCTGPTGRRVVTSIFQL